MEKAQPEPTQIQQYEGDEWKAGYKPPKILPQKNYHPAEREEIIDHALKAADRLGVDPHLPVEERLARFEFE